MSTGIRHWGLRYRAHNGVLRWAVVVLPSEYGPRNPTPPLPLVISPHGRGVRARTNARLWGALPARGPFAVICPGGMGRRLPLHSWGWKGQIDDLARMLSILRATRPWVRIDEQRVYAVGGSMAGQETLLLVGRHPRLLAGAVAFDSVTDFGLRYRQFARIARTRALQALARIEVGGTPSTNPEGYLRRSPMHWIQEIARSGVPLQILNYTFQSFNFRNRQGARPFYDLVANIAAEEFGHVELVAAAINTMLTGASPTNDGRAPKASLVPLKGVGNPHHFLAGGQGALPQNSQGRPWNGDYIFSSGDLVEDLTHNFFLETGARNNKLKVWEMVEHPAARALTGYLLVRGGVHQVAYARAIERLTGADLMKLFPTPRIPTEKIPDCKPHIERGDHLRLYRFSPTDYLELGAVFNGPHPETGEDLVVVDEAPEGVPAYDLPSQPAVFAPDYAPEEIAEIAQKLRVRAGLSKEPTGEVANGKRSASKPKRTTRRKAAARK